MNLIEYHKNSINNHAHSNVNELIYNAGMYFVHIHNQIGAT